MGDILHMYTISALYMVAIEGTIEIGEQHVRVAAKDYEAAVSLASEQIGNDLKKKGYINYHIVISTPDSTDHISGHRTKRRSKDSKFHNDVYDLQDSHLSEHILPETKPGGYIQHDNMRDR